MLKNGELIDFFAESEFDNLYDVFKTSSSAVNLELLSKFQSFSTFNDFFKSYINKDINSFFDFFKQLEEKYSLLCNNENYTNFNSFTDKYISIYANLILLSHLILKNSLIIKNIIMNVKNNLIKYYSENIINNDFQEKINECVNNLLNLSLLDDKRKIDYTPSNKTNNISTANATNTSINSMFKDNIFYNKENEFQDVYIEDNIKTPFFQSKSGSLINNIDIVNNNNNYNFIICRKKDSIGSILNLPCSEFKLEKNTFNKPDIKDKNNIISILINGQEIQSNNNNDTLNNTKIIKSKEKENNKEQKSKKGKKKNQNEKDNSKVNNKNIYKILLKSVNEIYKKGNIDETQKIKIKQLIILDSSKVIDLYNVFCSNSINKYIDYIKRLL
jgi:hypothetical protein